jgi:hypothetical protein
MGARFIQSRNPDVCLDSPALSQSVLCDLHRGMQKGLRGSRRRANLGHAVIEHLGRCRGSWFEYHILRLSAQLVLICMSVSVVPTSPRASQCNFSTVGYEHGGKRLGSWRNGRVVTHAIGSKELAREMSRLSKSTHFSQVEVWRENCMYWKTT